MSIYLLKHSQVLWYTRAQLCFVKSQIPGYVFVRQNLTILICCNECESGSYTTWEGAVGVFARCIHEERHTLITVKPVVFASHKETVPRMHRLVVTVTRTKEERAFAREETVIT